MARQAFAEVEFLAEDELLEIIPNFRMPKMTLVQVPPPPPTRTRTPACAPFLTGARCALPVFSPRMTHTPNC